MLARRHEVLATALKYSCGQQPVEREDRPRRSASVERSVPVDDQSVPVLSQTEWSPVHRSRSEAENVLIPAVGSVAQPTETPSARVVQSVVQPTGTPLVNVDQSVTQPIRPPTASTCESVAQRTDGLPLLRLESGSVRTQSTVCPTPGVSVNYLEPLSTQDVIQPDTRELIAMASERCAASTEFMIESPQRSRGRAKHTTKTRKQRSRAEVVREAFELHNDGLSLATVRHILSCNLKYATAHAALSRISQFDIQKRGKKIKAFKMGQQPSKQPMLSEDITRMIPKSVLSKVWGLVVRWQNNNPGVAEDTICVDIPGIGAFTKTTLNLIERWHRQSSG